MRGTRAREYRGECDCQAFAGRTVAVAREIVSHLSDTVRAASDNRTHTHTHKHLVESQCGKSVGTYYYSSE